MYKHYLDGIPIGVIEDNKVELLPDFKKKIQNGDRLVILATDDSAIDFSNTKKTSVEFKPNFIQKKYEKISLIRLNTKAKMLISEIFKQSEGNSKVVIYYLPQDAEDIQSLKNNLEKDISNNLETILLEDFSEEHLDLIVDREFTSIIILNQFQTDKEQSDADVIRNAFNEYFLGIFEFGF